jgi:hypothetical protein
MRHLREPTPEDIANSFVDVVEVDAVQVSINRSGGILYVNVNGICLLRICRIKLIDVEAVG